MGEWARPNDFFVACRLTSSKYADSFLDTGSIKFNTPQSWIDYSKKYGDGRGDGYEGTLVFCKTFLHNIAKKKYTPLRLKFFSK